MNFKNITITGLILFCILITFSGFQYNKEKEKKKEIKISGTFFRNIPYYMYINEVDSGEFSISSENVKIVTEVYKNKKLKVVFLVKQEMPTTKLLIKNKYKKEEISINIKSKHPPITIYFKGKSKVYRNGDKVNLDELLNGDFFTASVINYDVDMRLKIQDFELSWFNGGDYKEYKNDSHRIKEEGKIELKKLENETYLVLKNINVLSLNNEKLKTSPFILQITK